MVTLSDYPILDFSGGIRNDKSDFFKRDNEVVKIINFDIDDNGKLKKRLGSQQFGNTGTGNIENSVYWELQTAGSTPSGYHIISNTASTANIYQIVGTQLNGAVAVGDTTITVLSTTLFANSGTIEIDGDIITYTGKTATTFTGLGSSVTSAHLTDTAVHQLTALTGTSVNGVTGVYYATLNNLLFINGRVGSSTFDGSTMTAVGDADEPNGICATTYRQRIYLIDSGTVGGTPIRIYRSDPGDATSWTATEFFDVEDDRGEVPTGLISSISDELLIFKRNSFFSYNEVTLKQKSNYVGAYNQRVLQEINGLTYTFCPAGVFVTNGSSVKIISEPVSDWLKDFVPVMDTTVNRVVTNTFATKFKNKYLLYVGDVTTPGTYNDVVLCYDTLKKNWTIYTGWTDFQHLVGLNAFKFGNALQGMENLFGGDASGKYYRFFSKKYRENAGAGGSIIYGTGGEIFKDLISDTGTIISAEMESKYYDQKYPGVMKQYKYVRVLSEITGLNLAYSIENKLGKTEWKSLGRIDRQNQRFAFPLDAKGYRIAFRITDASGESAPILNGLILEETVLLDTR